MGMSLCAFVRWASILPPPLRMLWDQWPCYFHANYTRYVRGCCHVILGMVIIVYHHQLLCMNLIGLIAYMITEKIGRMDTCTWFEIGFIVPTAYAL